MITVEEALRLIERHRLGMGPTMATERIAIGDALDRVLAREVRARVTAPPRDVSAMDGYAVRAADLGNDAPLRVIGEAPAGAPFGGAVGPGEAVRLFTGSVVPDGADHVVIQEETRRENGTVVLLAVPDAPAHIRRAGIDFAEGDLLIEAGTRLGPVHIAAAAASDHETLEVHCRPKVALLGNGDELRAPGSNPAIGEVIASNAPSLAALVRRWGGEPVDLGIARDSRAAIGERLERAGDADIIVPVGGASVGDHDHMVAAFDDAGFETVFRKIAVKPGKPTWLAVRGAQVALGLPGNFASAYVCAHLFLRPLLGEPASVVAARTATALPANGSRETYLRATLETDARGVRQVSVTRRQDSSLITPFLECDALVRRPPGAPAIDAGGIVTVVPLER